ncbi:hypothetical protein HW555_002389 [Spodoptera exigua]|uniref:Uncharacterized protein n=1 Tax=Spodoptera exigua TaxID=7107 RepID=A0A835GR94_SPOEX|nr:hypothetical protein HW555_002389 [Spodoptera exigua]
MSRDSRTGGAVISTQAAYTQLRPRQHALLAVPEARTVAHANSPLVRVLTMLNSLLMSAPDCDLFAMRWIDLCRECLRYCQRMDDR